MRSENENKDNKSEKNTTKRPSTLQMINYIIKRKEDEEEVEIIWTS